MAYGDTWHGWLLHKLVIARHDGVAPGYHEDYLVADVALWAGADVERALRDYKHRLVINDQEDA